jgi:hypothetical protein
MPKIKKVADGAKEKEAAKQEAALKKEAAKKEAAKKEAAKKEAAKKEAAKKEAPKKEAAKKEADGSRACNIGPVPDVTDENFDQAFATYVENETASNLFNLYSYAEMADRSPGVRSEDIIKMHLLIDTLMGLGSQGRFKPKAIIGALVRLAANTATKIPIPAGTATMAWAKWMAFQLNIVTAHVRRCLNSGQKYLEACSRLSEADKEVFTNLINRWGNIKPKQNTTYVEDRGGAVGPCVLEGSCHVALAATHAACTGMYASRTERRLWADDEPKRKLQYQISCDSDGFPTMLNDISDSEGSDPKMPKSKKQKNEKTAKKDEKKDIEGAKGEKKAGLLEAASSAAGEPLPSERGSLKVLARSLRPTSVTKKPAASAPRARTSRGSEKKVMSNIFGEVRITPATASSYLCYKDESGRWKHIITVRHNLETRLHQKICWILLEASVNTGLAKLKRLREEMVKRARKGLKIGSSEEEIPTVRVKTIQRQR